MKKTLVRFFHVNFLRTWEFFWVAGVELHEKNSCEVFSCKFSPYLGVFLVAGVELHEKNFCEVFSCKFSLCLGFFWWPEWVYMEKLIED